MKKILKTVAVIGLSLSIAGVAHASKSKKSSGKSKVETDRSNKAANTNKAESKDSIATEILNKSKVKADSSIHLSELVAGNEGIKAAVDAALKSKEPQSEILLDLVVVISNQNKSTTKGEVAEMIKFVTEQNISNWNGEITKFVEDIVVGVTAGGKSLKGSLKDELAERQKTLGEFKKACLGA